MDIYAREPFSLFSSFRENAEARARLALVKFPPGVADRLHTHPKANQIIYGLSGEINTPSGRVVVEGSSVNITPRGEVHGRGDFLKESIALFYWDGPPDSELAE